MIIVIGCHTIKLKHKKQNAVEKLQSHFPVEVKLSHTKASTLLRGGPGCAVGTLPSH